MNVTKLFRGATRSAFLLGNSLVLSGCPFHGRDTRSEPKGESKCRASSEAPGISWRHVDSERDDHWGTAYTFDDDSGNTVVVVGLGVGSRHLKASAKGYDGPGSYPANIVTTKFEGAERLALGSRDALDGRLRIQVVEGDEPDVLIQGTATSPVDADNLEDNDGLNGHASAQFRLPLLQLGAPPSDGSSGDAGPIDPDDPSTMPAQIPSEGPDWDRACRTSKEVPTLETPDTGSPPGMRMTRTLMSVRLTKSDAEGWISRGIPDVRNTAARMSVGGLEVFG